MEGKYYKDLQEIGGRRELDWFDWGNWFLWTR